MSAFPDGSGFRCADPATSPQEVRSAGAGVASGACRSVAPTPRGARLPLGMCGMIENNHREEEGAPMLRKKKSLVDRAVDSASDAVDAALPVLENAVTQVREQARDLSKDAKAGAKELAKETRT